MKKTGVEARAVKRQAQLKKAKKFAEQLFDDNFRENAEPPSQELFEKIWTQILEVCTEKLTTAHQLRIAHTRLETLVRIQKWNVFIPTFVISRELPLQMRTGEWLSRAWAVYDSYENWVSNASPMLDDRDVYADLILSLIFHSGQCDKNVIKAFSQHLQSGDFLIQSLCEQLFVTLVLESKSEGLNTNIDRDGEQITQYQCYLHPFTVGLLRYWEKIQHKWSVPLEMDAIFQSISVRFVFPDKFPRSLRIFLNSAIYTVEQGKYLSQALVEYRSGRVNSYSLSSENIDRIENPVIYPCNIYSFSRPITATRPDVLIKSRRLRTEKLNDDVAMEKLRKCLILAKS